MNRWTGVAVAVAVALVAVLVLSWQSDDGDGGSSSATLKTEEPGGSVPSTGAGTRASSTTVPPTSASRSGPTNATATTAATATTGPGGEPGVGAADIGDPYFPGLGNGGYDVDRYVLDLAYDPDSDRLEGSATIEARATQLLERFHLDLSGMVVSEVSVDATTATFQRDGSELVIEPSEPVARGRSFTTVVRYGGVPEAAQIAGIGETAGWVPTDDGAYTLDEPDAAHTWFPSNDHPADRARFMVRMTVRDPLVVVASGRLVDRTTDDGRTTWSWDAADVMAPYLLQVAVGDFRIDESTTADGLPLRSAYSPSVADEAQKAAATCAEMIEYLESVIGPFPFQTYGVLVPAGAHDAVAFESQTLALIPPGVTGSDTILLHELAHQWFGDSVALARWSDIWLNEGFATYAEWLWAERQGRSFDSRVESAYAQAESFGRSAPPVGDPGVDQLFHPVVYVRGALTLQALRVEVGDTAFFEILRTWASRHRGDAVTTDDFVALAEEVSGRDLGALFDAWLGGGELPARPR